MTWGMCTFRDSDGRTRPGAYRINDGAVVELPVDYASTMAILDDWDTASAALRSFDAATADVIEGVVLLAPLMYPRKLICAGANYRDHVREMTGGEPAPGWQSWFFLAPPTTSVVGPGEDVLISGDPADKIDWEAELAVVMAHRVRDLAVDEVEQHVAGFVVFTDISARGLSARENPPHPAFAFDWISHKAQDTFSPMGPAVVPTWQVEDPDSLGIKLWVNDELKQDGNTRDMIIGWRQLIADVSRRITLEPGDVIATGTPAGVGAAAGTFLTAGDVVRVEIDGLGALTNPITVRT
ncbi:MAG: fumarylacetoacetate hydrolase family protein [Actinomycetes bacterium]